MKLNLNNVTLAMSAGFVRQFPSDRLPQVAFSGRSNVGKSSLINSLLNRKSLARVSSEPGKTITINFYGIDKKLYLVDLPGYGYAKRAAESKMQWSALTDAYFTNNPNIDSLRLVCQLVDSRSGPTEDDCDMLSYLAASGIPHIIIATKTDKLNATEKRNFLAAMESGELTASIPLIMYSSKTNLGRDDVWREITTAAKL